MTSNHVKAPWFPWAVSTGTGRFHEPNNVKLFIRSSITFNYTQTCDYVVHCAAERAHDSRPWSSEFKSRQYVSIALFILKILREGGGNFTFITIQ